MIVRISNEGQFRLDDSLHDRLNQLDDAAVAAVESGDEELVESQVILPPRDISFEEAKGEFTGDGLVPD